MRNMASMLYLVTLLPALANLFFEVDCRAHPRLTRIIKEKVKCIETPDKVRKLPAKCRPGGVVVATGPGKFATGGEMGGAAAGGEMGGAAAGEAEIGAGGREVGVGTSGATGDAAETLPKVSFPSLGAHIPTPESVGEATITAGGELASVAGGELANVGVGERSGKAAGEAGAHPTALSPWLGVRPPAPTPNVPVEGGVGGIDKGGEGSKGAGGATEAPKLVPPTGGGAAVGALGGAGNGAVGGVVGSKTSGGVGGAEGGGVEFLPAGANSPVLVGSGTEGGVQGAGGLSLPAVGGKGSGVASGAACAPIAPSRICQAAVGVPSGGERGAGDKGAGRKAGGEALGGTSGGVKGSKAVKERGAGGVGEAGGGPEGGRGLDHEKNGVVGAGTADGLKCGEGCVPAGRETDEATVGASGGAGGAAEGGTIGVTGGTPMGKAGVVTGVGAVGGGGTGGKFSLGGEGLSGSAGGEIVGGVGNTIIGGDIGGGMRVVSLTEFPRSGVRFNLKFTNGRCLSPEDDQETSGTKLVLPRDVCATKLAEFTRSATGNLKHVKTGFCVQPENNFNGGENSPLIIVEDCKKIWKFDMTTFGSLQVEYSGKCVQPADGGTRPSQTEYMVLRDTCDTPETKFTIWEASGEELGEGTNMGNVREGTNLESWDEEDAKHRENDQTPSTIKNKSYHRPQDIKIVINAKKTDVHTPHNTKPHRNHRRLQNKRKLAQKKNFSKTR